MSNAGKINLGLYQMVTEFLLSITTRCINAMNTGAGWEGWLQVELCVGLADSGHIITREQPYPYSDERIDLKVQTEYSFCGIEIKTETGRIADSQFGKKVLADIVKIRTYNQAIENFIVAICWSEKAKKQCAALKGKFPEALQVQNAEMDYFILLVKPQYIVSSEADIQLLKSLQEIEDDNTLDRRNNLINTNNINK